MPIYEYRCEDGHTFEVMQRMSDDPLVSCEACEAPVQRVFHPVAVHFKGSGFYNTDYGTRKRARENAESSKDEGSKGSDAKSDSKGESKPSESKPSESKSSDSKSSDSTSTATAPA
jgi:putative FmdB family regulatory protein